MTKYDNPKYCIVINDEQLDIIKAALKAYPKTENEEVRLLDKFEELIVEQNPYDSIKDFTA